MRRRDLALGPAARLSATAAAAAITLYIVFTAIPPGRRIDAVVVHRDLDFSWERAAELPGVVIRPPVVLLTMLVLCIVALLDRRPTDAARAVAVVGASAGLARVCENVLETIDPVGGEAMRALGPGWYPSGHAAAAMSVTVAALIVAPVALQARGLVLVAGAWPAIAGWALVSDAGHHPSDVVGGFLLATAIGSLLVLGRRRVRGHESLPWPAIGVGAATLLGACGVLAAIDDIRIPHSVFQPALILAGTIVAVIAFALAEAFDRALAAEGAQPRKSRSAAVS